MKKKIAKALYFAPDFPTYTVGEEELDYEAYESDIITVGGKYFEILHDPLTEPSRFIPTTIKNEYIRLAFGEAIVCNIFGESLSDADAKLLVSRLVTQKVTEDMYRHDHGQTGDFLVLIED